MRSSLLLPLLPLLGACAEAAAPGAGDASRRGLTPPPPYAAPALPDEPELIAALSALDGITLHDVYSVYDGSTALSLSITQPVDHDVPDGPTFEQYLTLRSFDVAQPMSMVFTGYDDFFGHTLMRVADTLGANQISVGKRYAANSVPAGDIDWSTMTAAQIAADNHRIVETLREVYPGPWVSEGYSQGGLDAMSHRMRYPDDVVGTLAAGAPLVTSLADDRALDFFASPPDAACQDALETIRTALLTPDADGGLFEDAVDSVRFYEEGGYTFDRIGSLETDVGMYLVEFPFVFWMYYSDYCAELPDPAIAPTDAVAWGMSLFFADHADQNLEGVWGGYAVQLTNENGYPTMPLDGIEDLVDPDWPAYYELLPLGAEAKPFDSLAEDLQAWTTDEAENLLLLQGDRDPWAQFAADVTNADPSVVQYTVAGGDHNTQLYDVPASDQAELEAMIEAWID